MHNTFVTLALWANVIFIHKTLGREKYGLSLWGWGLTSCSLALSGVTMVVTEVHFVGWHPISLFIQTGIHTNLVHLQYRGGVNCIH